MQGEGSESRLIFLANVRTVLLNTTHPGNIGAVARALKTMSLSDLTLVSPKLYPHADATARASGADDLLANARVVQTMDEAVSQCHLVLGLSARERKIRWPTLNAREAGQLIWQACRQHPVAVVLGRERTGMTNEELDRCHYLVQIPANPEYPSLNIAMAAQIMAYEIAMAGLNIDETVPAEVSGGVDAKTMEAFYAHLEKTLVDIDFLDPENPKKLPRRLRRLFNRARPDSTEIKILRGILTAAQNKRRTD